MKPRLLQTKASLKVKYIHTYKYIHVNGGLHFLSDDVDEVDGVREVARYLLGFSGTGGGRIDSESGASDVPAP